MLIQTKASADTLREINVRRTSAIGADYAAGTAPQTQAAAADSSAVTLSLTSALRASSATDIDMDTVASIKAALRDGSYSMNSSNIADGILGMARDLMRKAPRE
ncbi:anti-sigma-28 factor FlgM [Caballeronia temeraria]|uniref:Negative regulator of flagellin synthesis n=1 Tax=Caballeronia temeraria TaxID=1777137 RepID=A0A158DXW9_9BURK|nr:flagellar biosynthesis anti-sigma factor FlgM [Caballeronia temeraria]SAK99240.1 anti-sigma-28 factor FlgM [Caballeronia temeraria]